MFQTLLSMTLDIHPQKSRSSAHNQLEATSYHLYGTNGTSKSTCKGAHSAANRRMLQPRLDEQRLRPTARALDALAVFAVRAAAHARRAVAFGALILAFFDVLQYLVQKAFDQVEKAGDNAVVKCVRYCDTAGGKGPSTLPEGSRRPARRLPRLSSLLPTPTRRILCSVEARGGLRIPPQVAPGLRR